MTQEATTGQATQGAGPHLETRFGEVGGNLADSLRALLAALPGGPHRPSRLAKLLDVNRAVTSRLLTATGKRDPLEVLHLVPGPEPLRKLVTRLGALDVPTELLKTASAAINAFDQLIAEEAGTRPALDALISPQLPGAREKLELSSRYSIFRGVSQLKGVQGDLWVGTAIVTPSEETPDKLDLTWLNGAVAMQRLRPGVSVRFSYRFPRKGDDPDEASNHSPTGEDVLPAIGVTSLEQFCVNPPARLEARRAGEAIHYTLPEDILGPKDKVDMFVVDHHPASMKRFADAGIAPGERDRTALFIEPAIPVANLHFDVILHEEAFPGCEPQLYFYDTGYDGIANVNDETRDIDRVDLVAPLEMLGSDLRRYTANELASYGPMLQHLANRFGWDPTRFRGYRLSLQYPVYGWQVCMAFQKPQAPKPG